MAVRRLLNPQPDKSLKGLCESYHTSLDETKEIFLPLLEKQEKELKKEYETRKMQCRLMRKPIDVTKDGFWKLNHNNNN